MSAPNLQAHPVPGYQLPSIASQQQQQHSQQPPRSMGAFRQAGSYCHGQQDHYNPAVLSHQHVSQPAHNYGSTVGNLHQAGPHPVHPMETGHGTTTAGGMLPYGHHVSASGQPPMHDALHLSPDPGAGLPPPPSALQTPQPPRPIRRRMRMINSCLECRRRKLKCSKAHPCANCVRFNRECIFLGNKLDEDSQAKLTQIKEKVGSLERQFERDVAKKTSSLAETQQRIIADDVEGEFGTEKDLELTPMVALDLTYEDDAKDDDILDLGIKIGKMRITERIGGLSRPRISEEISAGLQQNRPQGSIMPPFALTVADPSAPDFLKPTEAYLPPSCGYLMGHEDSSEIHMDKYMVDKSDADQLIQHYFEVIHPVARCVHRPSFEADYVTYWFEVSQGLEPHGSVMALVFAAMFSAAVSLDEAACRNMKFSYKVRSKAELVQQLKLGTEAALTRANFLRTTRVATLQAFIMYMIPLCREEVSRSHSVLVGAAVRMAECMGLHRDGSGYGLSPLETHVRRIIWHQLCFLDIRTCEAQGPRPTIRREDYDTKIPLNVEDEDLTDAIEPPQPRDGYTSALLPLIRFEINEMMRNIWADRRRLELRKVTLTEVLTKNENFRQRLLDKYAKFLDENVPIQRYTKLVMNLLAHRLIAMVLHPYFANTANPMPQFLNKILISASITILDMNITLATDPFFAKYRWYIGAYQQNHVALILATEMFYRPHNPLADKIWNCLDWVFELPPDLSRESKGMYVLHEIMGKSAWYRSLRKVRAPEKTAGAVPSGQAALVKGTSSPTTSMNTSPQQHPSSHVPLPPAQMAPQGPPRGPTGPEPGMVFAGISDGEAIWSFPRMPDSPETIGDENTPGYQHRLAAQQQGQMPVMADYGDMDVINSLFPIDPQTGLIQTFGMHPTHYGLPS